ncbi:MAG TPA: ATP-binding protein [Fibrobacteria bacterium]|nr:ATP-binding protein [Fibrobacteria bacterium]
MTAPEVAREPILAQLRRYHGKPLIKALTGMRRVGKSVALQHWHQELSRSSPSCHILHIDKESPTWDHVREKADLWRLAHELPSESPRVLLLDEVQMIEGWEQALAALLAERFEIVVTGSNAKLLSSDLATLLAGRHVELPVWPLGFAEFLELRRRNASEQLDRDTEFARFLRYGGLPALHHFQWDHEVVGHYLRTVFDSVLFRDVIQRHNIRNTALLERVARFAFDSVGSPLTTKSIADFMKSQGIRSGQSTIEEYLGCLASAYGIWPVRRLDIQGKRLLEFNAKYYAGDTGLRNAMGGFREADISKTLENLVFLELKRRGCQVHIGRIGDYEIDFVAERDGVRTYVQVAWKLESLETLERELRPLRMIRDKHPCMVVSMDPHFNGTSDGIRHIRAEDFLMGAE